MPLLNELREKRNKLLHDAGTIMQSETVSAEQRDAATRMIAESDVVDQLITREERAAQAEAEARNVPPTHRPQPEAGDVSPEQRKSRIAEATRQWMATGSVDAEHRSFLAERRDLTTGTAGAVIAQEFYPQLIMAQKLYGPIAQMVAQRKTANNGAPMKLALMNDSANALVTIGENTTVPANADPAFSSVIVSTDIITTKIVKVTLAELNDSSFNLEAWLRDAFGERFGRGMENYVTNGNGANVASLIAAAHASAITAPAAGPKYTDLANLYGQLEPAYLPNAKFAMSSATRATLMGEVDSFGRPLLQASGVDGKPFSSIFGADIVLNQSLPALGASVTGAIQFGDFARAYLLRTDGDLQIVRFSELYMANLEVGLMGVIRAGGVSLDAGTHPLVNLVQSAT